MPSSTAGQPVVEPELKPASYFQGPPGGRAFSNTRSLDSEIRFLHLNPILSMCGLEHMS